MWLIHIYNILNIILLPLYLIIGLIRVIKKKDNIYSLSQKFGFNKPIRPPGKLIWIHAASVGESMIAITLFNALSQHKSNYHFLITTGTLSSAQILAKSLPVGIIHQFTPIDNIFIVKNFLNHWKPDLGIFIESELWPCLALNASKICNLLLVNARLSDISYKRWQSKKQLFQLITLLFKMIIVQSDTDFKKYTNLGCKNIKNLGNLKFSNKELTVDNNQLDKLKNIFNDKAIFVAASTHQEDEAVILRLVKDLKKHDINSIIILRHPERRDEVAKYCKNLGLKYSLRSQNIAPSLADDVYIVDNFGELGTFYRISSVVFVGGSFKNGGHNPLEPAYFDNVVIFGPNMSNVSNVAEDMLKKNAAIQITTTAELKEKIIFFLSKEGNDSGQIYKKNAKEFVQERKKIIDDYLKEIEKLLP